MRFITLVNTDNALLGTKQLVFDANETGVLKSIAQKVVQLDECLQSAEETLKQATATAHETAREQGQRQGYAAGLVIAQDELTRKLLHAQQVQAEEFNNRREVSVELALSIVRKIGLLFGEETGEASILVSLVHKSAQELQPDEKAELHVHPTLCEQVSSQLSVSPGALPDWLIQVVPDDQLAEDECVLETHYGSIHAGLEAQLKMIQASLHEQ